LAFAALARVVVGAIECLPLILADSSLEIIHVYDLRMIKNEARHKEFNLEWSRKKILLTKTTPSKLCVFIHTFKWCHSLYNVSAEA